MSEHMYRVLARLIAAEEADMPFVDLSDVHGATRSALCRHDWAFASPGLDGLRYRVTGRGKKAYQIYSMPVEQYRYDGICPTCGVRAKGYYASGKPRGYCEPCDKQTKRRSYRLRQKAWNRNGAGRLCPSCQQRPVHVSPGGHVHPYCLPCKRAYSVGERQRKHARKLARIAAGEHIGCLKCDAPVYHTGTQVYDYCRDCYFEYQRQYRARRREADHANA